MVRRGAFFPVDGVGLFNKHPYGLWLQVPGCFVSMRA